MGYIYLKKVAYRAKSEPPNSIQAQLFTIKIQCTFISKNWWNHYNFIIHAEIEVHFLKIIFLQPIFLLITKEKPLIIQKNMTKVDVSNIILDLNSLWLEQNRRHIYKIWDHQTLVSTSLIISIIFTSSFLVLRHLFRFLLIVGLKLQLLRCTENRLDKVHDKILVEGETE